MNKLLQVNKNKSISFQGMFAFIGKLRTDAKIIGFISINNEQMNMKECLLDTVL